jgi:hypothetical protein
MTVNELILQLMELPPDDEVYAVDSEGDAYQAFSVEAASELRLANKETDIHGWVGICIDTTS